MQEKVAIVVPTHKGKLTPSEKNSLDSLQQHLDRYDKFLVFPKGLVFDWDTSSFTKKEFSKRRFKSVDAYCRMCLDPRFYEHFKDYEYLLFFQPDCIIFKDDLAYWCEQGFSYIGAPWVQKFPFSKLINSLSKAVFNRSIKSKLVYKGLVGNGGLSLRCVEDSIKLLKEDFKLIRFLPRVAFHLKKREMRNFLLSLFSVYSIRINYSIGKIARLISYSDEQKKQEGKKNKAPIPEDAIFCSLGLMNKKFFKIPGYDEALKFSIEAEGSLKHLKQKPFGAHNIFDGDEVNEKYTRQFSKVEV